MSITLQRAPPRPSLSWSGTEIPSLYGYRGVAALVVVIGHAVASGSSVSYQDYWSKLGDSFAVYAVIAFFVLSGFLITHLLLREHDKTGTVALQRFYVRRMLRIFPAFYGYAACYCVGRLLLKTRLPTDWVAVAACVLYIGNYVSSFTGHGANTMVHTWSLAVEEQFYLVWPGIFSRWAENRAALMKGLVAAIAAVWLWRQTAGLFGISTGLNSNYVYSAFETRADALAIGCLLAIANAEGLIPRRLIEWKWVGALAVALSATVATGIWNGPRYGWIVMAVTSAVILVHSIAHSRTVWYRWLNSRPLHALGVISYSLYLYHPFMLRVPAAIRVVPVEVAAALGLATASYWIVERPFLWLRDRRLHRQAPLRPADGFILSP